MQQLGLRVRAVRLCDRVVAIVSRLRDRAEELVPRLDRLRIVRVLARRRHGDETRLAQRRTIAVRARLCVLVPRRARFTVYATVLRLPRGRLR